MEFEIDQTRFLAALNLAQTVADRRSTIPVLANVLLTATDDALVLSATDMSIALTETVPCKGAAPGSLTIGVRNLHAVVKTLKPGPMRIKALDNSWAQLLAGRSEFKLMGLPAGDFPEVPKPDDVEFASVDAHALADLIAKVIVSVSADEARVNLNGALLERNGETATMVSTDGHRLTKYAAPVPVGPGHAVIVPRKGLDEVRRVLSRVDGDVEVGFSGKYLFVKTEDFMLSVKLNDVTFPPYAQVIPKDRSMRVSVDRDELAAALRQAVVIAPEKTSVIKLEVGPNFIRLAADNPELGAIKLELPAESDGDQELSAGFNAQYLLDALTSIDDDRVLLDFQGALDPVTVRPASASTDGSDFLAVVMPMRI